MMQARNLGIYIEENALMELAGVRSRTCGAVEPGLSILVGEHKAVVAPLVFPPARRIVRLRSEAAEDSALGILYDLQRTRS
jgi:hypothetical protein